MHKNMKKKVLQGSLDPGQNFSVVEALALKKCNCLTGVCFTMQLHMDSVKTIK